MNHDAELKLQAFLDGELPEREAAEVRDWLARDAEARSLIAELQNTGAVLAGHEADIKLPESREFFWSKIQREIEHQARPAAAPARGTSWLVWLTEHLVQVGGVAVAACLLLFLIRPSGGAEGRVAEIVVASDDVGAYRYRDEQEGLTMVWFYDRKADSQFTPAAALAKLAAR